MFRIIKVVQPLETTFLRSISKRSSFFTFWELRRIWSRLLYGLREVCLGLVFFYFWRASFFYKSLSLSLSISLFFSTGLFERCFWVSWEDFSRFSVKVFLGRIFSLFRESSRSLRSSSMILKVFIRWLWNRSSLESSSKSE